MQNGPQCGQGYVKSADPPKQAKNWRNATSGCASALENHVTTSIDGQILAPASRADTVRWAPAFPEHCHIAVIWEELAMCRQSWVERLRRVADSRLHQL